jgi:hypothetical protein
MLGDFASLIQLQERTWSLRHQFQRHSANYSSNLIGMENIGYYLFLLAAIIVAFFIIKKVTTCLVKSVVLIVLAVVLAAVYFLYLK